MGDMLALNEKSFLNTDGSLSRPSSVEASEPQLGMSLELIGRLA